MPFYPCFNLQLKSFLEQAREGMKGKEVEGKGGKEVGSRKGSKARVLMFNHFTYFSIL